MNSNDGGAHQQDVLKSMIMTLRVSDLQMLLGFAGRNKNGVKHELQARALELVKIRSTPMQAKIRELYKASQQSQQQQAAADAAMLGQQQQPMGYHYAAAAAMNLMAGNTYASAAAMNLAPQQQQQSSRSNNNPYAGYTAPAPPVYSYQMQQQQQQQQQHQAALALALAARVTLPAHPDLRLVKLPFYDVRAELLRPSTLPATQGNARFHEAQFQFFLTPQQATDIASNRDISIGPTQVEYLHQIQLRFCQLTLEAGGKEMPDEFPNSICVQVNGKMVPLPNPIPTNKPGVEPKRPPRPVNISNLCKLSPILPNNVNIKWASGMTPGWVVGIWLVVKLTSDDLLERLKKKGTRNPEFTRGLIVEKLNDDDEVATTSLKVSVSCPLGKMRMQIPCRPSTCSHLQCFDASLFLQMNERKPTWNCPVCDSKALYDTLLIDGYFQDVLESPQLSKDENEILLEGDGNWRPVPKDDEKTKPPSSLPPTAAASSLPSNGGSAPDKKGEEDVECIDLSDDEGGDLPPLPPGPVPPPLPTYQPESDQPPPPPLPPLEIECIDLD